MEAVEGITKVHYVPYEDGSIESESDTLIVSFSDVEDCPQKVMDFLQMFGDSEDHKRLKTYQKHRNQKAYKLLLKKFNENWCIILEYSKSKDLMICVNADSTYWYDKIVQFLLHHPEYREYRISTKHLSTDMFCPWADISYDTCINPSYEHILGGCLKFPHEFIDIQDEPFNCDSEISEIQLDNLIEFMVNEFNRAEDT